MAEARHVASVVIATKDRPEELLSCIRSLRRQTTKVSEVIIVDAGRTPGLEATLREALEGSGTALKYSAARPNASAQRNFGVTQAAGDIVFFFDDDVELEPDYVERILRVYDERDAAGVQGVDISQESYRPRLLRHLFNRVFMLDHSHKGEDRFLPSGNYLGAFTRPYVSRSLTFGGFCMSFRRGILEEYRFDENLGGYSFKEDLDLTYRISLRHELYTEPNARLLHKVSPKNRLDRGGFNRRMARNNMYLFRKNFNRSTFQRVCFAWSVLGGILLSAYSSVRFMTFGPVRGYLQGLLDGVGARPAALAR